MDHTLEFVRKRFCEYYSKNDVFLPPRFGRREYGFLFFNRDGMERHTGFSRADVLKRFLSVNGPRHVYHSSAYYQRPGAGTMKEKGWMGADLIFDIDADHLKGAEGLTYQQMLARTKDEIIRLSDDFLTGDMGFDMADVHFVFSGGRGYHIHVTDPRVLSLGSDERREIVDYITGTDLDFSTIFRERAVGGKLFMGHGKVHHGIDIPKRDAPGWRGRMRKGLDKLLSDLEALPEELAIERLMTVKGLGEKGAKAMYKDLFKGEGGERGVDKMRDRDVFEVFSDDRHRRAFMELAKGYVVAVAGETDAPVTKDINRLIRLPGSLHGKSSLRVVPLTRDALNGFEPLRDAIAFDDKPVKVTVAKPSRVEMGGKTFDVKEGEMELPLFAAMFLLCRGAASVPA